MPGHLNTNYLQGYNIKQANPFVLNRPLSSVRGLFSAPWQVLSPATETWVTGQLNQLLCECEVKIFVLC